MRFALMKDGSYYRGPGRNKFDLAVDILTDELPQAALFLACASGGEIRVTPELPKGEWDMVAVRMEEYR